MKRKVLPTAFASLAAAAMLATGGLVLAPSAALADGCPPGLAKKHNGCMPPGQAKKHHDRHDDRRRHDEHRRSDRDDRHREIRREVRRDGDRDNNTRHWYMNRNGERVPVDNYGYQRMKDDGYYVRDRDGGDNRYYVRDGNRYIPDHQDGEAAARRLLNTFFQ